MSLVGRPAENHPQQVGARGALDKVDDRRTPLSLWEPLDAEFQFDIDVAASSENALCDLYFTRDDDGLSEPWMGSVWCNPPYSDIRAWVEKAWREIEDNCTSIVMLLPANRTEQGWWQDLIEPSRRFADEDLEVRFLRGRLRFDTPDHDYTKQPKGNRPPFGCCLVIWKGSA